MVVLGWILKGLCLAFALAFAIYALSRNQATLDPTDLDGIERAKRSKMIGWLGAGICALFFGVLFLVSPATASSSPTAQNDTNAPATSDAVASGPAASNPSAATGRGFSPPAANSGGGSQSSNYAMNPGAPPPPSSQPMAGPGAGMGTAPPVAPTLPNGSDNSSGIVPAASGPPQGRIVVEPAAQSDDNSRRYPFAPVRLNFSLRYSADDRILKDYVSRIVRQAEAESGIAVSSSQDKFACVRVTAKSCLVYADGKQAKLAGGRLYYPQHAEGAAGMALFHPAVRVVIDRSTGQRASFAPYVNWEAMHRGLTDDSLEVCIFPSRKRVVVNGSIRCSVENQFPDGLPSVYDLQGGTISFTVLKNGDLGVPRVVYADDVEAHDGPESQALEASLAPRVSDAILSISVASEPPGSVDLSPAETVIRPVRDGSGAYELYGPIRLSGFPAMSGSN